MNYTQCGRLALLSHTIGPNAPPENLVRAAAETIVERRNGKMVTKIDVELAVEAIERTGGMIGGQGSNGQATSDGNTRQAIPIHHSHLTPADQARQLLRDIPGFKGPSNP